MNLRRSSLVVIVVLLLTALPATAGSFKKAKKNGVPDLYLVLLADGVAAKPGGGSKDLPEAAAVARSLVAAHGGDLREVWEHALLGFLVRLPEARARKLAADPRVAAVEQDSTISAPVGHCYSGNPWADARPLPSPTASPQAINCPNPHPDGDALDETFDPLCPDNWGLDRTDQVHFDEQFVFSRNGTNVHAYVLDTGIRSTHREFRDANGVTRVEGGVDARNEPAVAGTAANTADQYGHGTHVAGIIGGRTFGVAKNVRLHPVRTFGAPGTNGTAEEQLSDAVRGINWIVQDVNRGPGTADDNRPAVVNWSGGNDQDWIASENLRAAVSNLLDNDIILVQSAGNHEPDYDDAGGLLHDVGDFAFGEVFPDVIVVGGMDHNVERWTIDGCQSTATPTLPAGFECGSLTGSSIDLWAPAAWVISANRTGDSMTCKLSGTSMAAPHVTGAVAAYLQQNPAATADEVTRALRGNGHWYYLTDNSNGQISTKTIGPDSDNVFVRLNTISMPSDLAPVASFTVQCPGSTCSFNASSSTDEGTMFSYRWSFGDGTTGWGQTINHTYAAGFTGYAVLEVMDASGKTDHLRKQITAGDDPLNAPAGLIAVANGTTVTITWNTVAGADGYDLYLKFSAAGYTVRKNVAGGSSVQTTDVPPASANGVVLYYVVARAGASSSAPSNSDVAYVGTFLDAVIVPQSTKVKAAPITEMRMAVNGLCILAGQPDLYSASEVDANVLRGQFIDAGRWTSLMTNLSNARLGVQLPPWTWSGGTPAFGQLIDDAHLNSLRNGVK